MRIANNANGNDRISIEGQNLHRMDVSQIKGYRRENPEEDSRRKWHAEPWRECGAISLAILLFVVHRFNGESLGEITEAKLRFTMSLARRNNNGFSSRIGRSNRVCVYRARRLRA